MCDELLIRDFGCFVELFSMNANYQTEVVLSSVPVKILTEGVPVALKVRE